MPLSVAIVTPRCLNSVVTPSPSTGTQRRCVHKARCLSHVGSTEVTYYTMQQFGTVLAVHSVLGSNSSCRLTSYDEQRSLSGGCVAPFAVRLPHYEFH